MNTQINYIDILNIKVLNSLISHFDNVKNTSEKVDVNQKEYGLAQKNLAIAKEILDSVYLCLLLLEEKEQDEFNLEAEKLFNLIMKEESGDRVIIEIRAAAGGDEAGLFAKDLCNMYRAYSTVCGWKFEELSKIFNDVGGYKNCTVKIIGEGSYSKLFLESGVHRVQRVPDTDPQRKIHTSTVSVYVYKEISEKEQTPINEKDLKITFCRSSGAGGQHVNTTDSAVRIEHIPTGLVVECQNERSQHMNKASAMQVLTSRLYNLQKQQEQQKINSDRSMNIGTADRSEKIRTYNYKDNRITDHRFNVQSKNLTLTMIKDFDVFINEILFANTILKITSFSEN